jgi:hypothetical protein
MDFLEGFLLGPVWSDTEYETHRHTGFYWFIGWLGFAAYAYLKIFPEKIPSWMNMPTYLPITFFLVFSVISPFACRYYYRLNIFLKLCIQLFQILKFGFAFLAFFQFLLPVVQIDPADVPTMVLDYINQTVAKTTNYFEKLGQGVGMLVGIASGGLLIVLTFAGALLVATLLPVIYLIALKLYQRGIDLLARLTVIKGFD